MCVCCICLCIYIDIEDVVILFDNCKKHFLIAFDCIKQYQGQ